MKLPPVLLALFLSGCEALTSFRNEERAKEAVAKLLIDPSSAEFRQIEVRDGYVCGLVNGKNRTGAYVGFKKFVVGMSGWKVEIDPELDYGDVLSARDLCTSMQGNSYASASSTSSACGRALELEAEQLVQDHFNSAWKAHCEGSARLPFRPPLGTVTEATPEPSDNLVADVPDTGLSQDLSAANLMDAEMNATNFSDNENDE